MSPAPNPNEDSLLDLSVESQDSIEEIESQVQKAQEQLLQLKRQQDSIERQKRDLEELSRRQSELDQGRAEMIDKLHRAVVVLERESYETQKRYEQLVSTRESFLEHLDLLEKINPKHWDKNDINKELNRALSSVDDARTAYSKSRSKVNAEATTEVITDIPSHGGLAEEQPRDFVYWLKSGFAFTLPLLALGLLALLVLLLRLSP